MIVTSHGNVRQKEGLETACQQEKALAVSKVMTLLMEFAIKAAQMVLKALENFVSQANALLDTLNAESIA